MSVISDLRASPWWDYRPDATSNPQPKRLDNVRTVLRPHHTFMQPERSSVDRIVRFVHVHGLRSREDLFPAEPKIEAFLTDLAVHGHVAPATQNQALHALVCLDTRVLTPMLPGPVSMPCAPTRSSTSPWS
jgi:hypothetical protein